MILMTSDLEDDKLGLLNFTLFLHNVLTEAFLHPGVHGLVSILEEVGVLQIACSTPRPRRTARLTLTVFACPMCAVFV